MNRSPRLLGSGRILAWFLVLPLLLVCARWARPPLSNGVALSQTVYDRSGQLLRFTLATDQKYRVWLKLGEISPALVDGTLLLEDRHFRSHLGVNPVSVARAFWQTYVARGRRVGGSTLTMQLARIKYGLLSRSLSGKLMQIFRALQLETLYSKTELLEAYLNLVPYGGNIEGVGAASLVYFQKPASKLTLGESLTLAVIPQNPNKRGMAHSQPDPNLGQALAKAREALFDRWIEAHPNDRLAAVEMRTPISVKSLAQLPFQAPHFVDAILAKGLHRVAQQSDLRTTLDLATQHTVESAVQAYLERQRRIGVKNAAAMLIDLPTMDVRAQVGSADYWDSSIQGQVNGALAKRSPGSALKPFLYALAMDQGLIHPYSLLKDSPVSYGGFDPENFDGQFEGPISVHDALIRSRNIPALQVTSQLKTPSLYDFLAHAGITRLKDEKYYGLSLALGGAEVTMEELLPLYAMLWHRGVRKPMRKLKDDPETGSVQGVRLLSPEASFMVLDILADNPRPGQNFQSGWTRDGFPVSWKTGTSHGFRDAWSVGIFGNYALAVWVGDFAGAGNPALIGREMAGPLFFQIIDALKSSDRSFRTLATLAPPSLTRVKVCAVSGDLPGPFCKHQLSSWFVPGKSPIHTCEIHRQIAVRPGTGKRACPLSAGPVQQEVFEFWPSDLLRIFRQAGIPRRLPPAFEPGCKLADRSLRGNAPQIISPKPNLTYAFRAMDGEHHSIPLSASADSDARELYWFADSRFIGKSGLNQPFFWDPPTGRFLIRVVDDQGRSDARDLQVSVVR